MTERNPLPECLSHLQQLIRATEAREAVRTFKYAAAWIQDSQNSMNRDTEEWRWANGASRFLWQLADERSGIWPWASDMHNAAEFGRPILVGKRGTTEIALVICDDGVWKHTDSLDPICFQPDIWQPLPRFPK